MKTVLIIDEVNHGTIGVAENYNAALAFLLHEHWIDEGTEVWEDDEQAWVTLLDKFGSVWLEALLHLDVDEFNRLFTDCFSLDRWEVETESESE